MSATVQAEGGRLSVRGHVDWEDCDALRLSGNALIAQADGDIEIDLSGLERPESRVLAVMLAWVRAADKRDALVRFVGVPQAIDRMAEFTGLQEILEGLA